MSPKPTVLLKYRMLSCPLLCLGLMLSAPTVECGIPGKVVDAVRAAVPPAVDGVLDDPVWQSARPATDFMQFDPEEGGAPTESTSVRLLYDDDAFYVAVMCYDRDPDAIVPQLTRRDRTVEADRFTVQIDSYHDRQTAFVFSTSVSGVQSDGVLSQDGIVYDIQWDAVWDVQTRVTGDGWSAEFRIPFHALRFTENGGDLVWGINFRRYISRKRETLEWVMIPRTERAAVSLWGEVHGIRNILPPLHLALAPYVSGRASFETAAGDRPAQSDQEATAGLDLKYGLTRGFTLDATINPDFGQVEVDQAVLNLTVFETLFPEKRPFFTEGSQLFAFGTAVDKSSLPLFFSRRIGKRPSGSGAVGPPAGGSIEKNPQSTTILGAAKISGRTPSGLWLGALAAATDEEAAELRLADRTLSRLRTEPRGAYQVLRIKQEFGQTSWIGGMLTGVAHQNTLPAFSGGMDWNLRLDEGRYAVDGFFAGAQSSAEGTGRSGAAGRLVFARISSEHWFYTGAYDAFSRRFSSNDMGFFAQPHDHGGYAQLLYRENFAAYPLRRYYGALNPEFRWNWDGLRTQAALNTSLTCELMNFWVVSLNHSLGLPAYDDAERGLLGIYRRPVSNDVQISVQTDERAGISATLSAGYALDAREKQGFSSLGQVKLRPASWLDLTPSVYYQHIRGERTGVFGGGGVVQYVQDGRAWSLFGDRHVDLLDLGLRGTVTFTTTLSLQMYGQVLLARGTYRNFGLLAGDARFLMPAASPSSYDFNLAVLNANLLFRWEYMPGSTVYLVWTQGRAGDSGVYGTGFGTRLGETLALPHEDVLLLKISYWFPL